MEMASKPTGGRGGGDRKKAVSKSAKAGLQFPVGRLPVTSRKDVMHSVTAAALRFISPPSLSTLLLRCWNWRGMRHVLLAVRNDEELGKLLQGVTIASGGVLPNINAVLLPKKASSSPDKDNSNPKSPN